MYTVFDQERETKLYHERLKKQATEEGLAEGRAEGEIAGITKGRLSALTDAVAQLSRRLNIDQENAMDMLGINKDERVELRQALSAQ